MEPQGDHRNVAQGRWNACPGVRARQCARERAMITGIGEWSRVFLCVPPARSPMLVNMEIHSVRTVIYLLVGTVLLLVPLGCTKPSTQPSKTDVYPSVAPAAQPQVESWRQRWTVE